MYANIAPTCFSRFVKANVLIYFTHLSFCHLVPLFLFLHYG